MSSVLEFGVFLVGLFFGIWWFSLVILPLVYGLPRSGYWAVRGYVKWRVVPLYLVSPLLWTAVLSGVALVITLFLPTAATYLRESGGFAFGQILGITIITVRAIFSRSTHIDMSLDFYDFVRPYLTQAG